MKHIISTAEQGSQRPENAAVAPVSPSVLQLRVDADSADQRLDNFLIRHLKGVPKSHVYRIIRSGEVRVNKGRAAAETRVQNGDVVRVPPVRVSAAAQAKTLTMAQGAALSAPARVFPILFEDDDLLVIDKPAGVAVHGGSGVSFGVIEQLRMARPASPYLELVHRLDRETSGVLLVAKKRSALKTLQDQFRGRETGKTYLALVVGRWPKGRKVLDKPLHKYLDAQGERRVKVVGAQDPDGMRSVTLVKVQQVFSRSPGPQAGPDSAVLAAVESDFSLLEVTIKTGRTHQIRVHLASEGFPIAGDDKYGVFDLNKQLQKAGLKRMFLHAWRLSVLHPRTQESLQLTAALPSELAAWIPNPGPQPV